MALLAYAPLLFGLGFYWDDWPWLYLSHRAGPLGMLTIDRAHRPLAGLILSFGSWISGQSPLGWQLINLLYRWAGGLALLGFLRQLWPRHSVQTTWVALLFLVYPGFQQQYVSINSSRHILPLALFFLSLGWMVRSARRGQNRKLLTGASFVSGLAAMLSTEYYFGLELLRPVLLWFVYAEQVPPDGWRCRMGPIFQRVLFHWSPFAFLLAAIFTWRYWVSTQVNYPITLAAGFAQLPFQTAFNALQTILLNMFTVVFAAWRLLMNLPTRAQDGLLVIAIYIFLTAGAAALTLAFFWRRQSDSLAVGFWKSAILLGTLAALLGGLPFLVTGLDISLNFPEDRAALSLMLAACLVWAGLLDLLGRRRLLQVGLLALIVGLSTGAHFVNALSYQRDWQAQRDLFQQLAWRVPGLKPGVSIYYLYNLALQDFRSTDNSLTAPLNWIYAPEATTRNLDYYFFDLKLRVGSRIPVLQSGQPVEAGYGNFEFHGSTDAVIVLHYVPPACLRVLHPVYDALDPQMPELLHQALPLSQLDLIQTQPRKPVLLPSQVFGENLETGWCYYFEKADLARQFEDWQQVVAIGEIALQHADHPNHAAELIPFIQGYAITGDFLQAYQLTLRALKINTSSEPMLCAYWEDLVRRTPAGDVKDRVIAELENLLACSLR